MHRPLEETRDEAGFWDARADEAEYRARMAISPEESIAGEAWLRAFEPLLPDLRGRTVLDCGTGLGSLAAWCARRGAKVVGFDLSGGMARLAGAYGRRWGVELSMMVSTFEELALRDGAVDVAVGQYILHHTDVDRSVEALARVVKPGGMGLFVENMALNPLVRRYVTSRFFEEGVLREGSPEECPILPEKVRRMEQVCREVRLHWPSFVFFEILCARLPLVPRRLGQAVDDGLFRLMRGRPALLRNSYFALIELRF
jgi:2-polyprenyl-3-methyl-5-hydroxy-6-metoxy-1,4-benzoquinol methylase